MSKEVQDGKKINLKIKTRYPKLQFDKLQMYMGYPYVIDLEGVAGVITVTEPSLGQLIHYGEKAFFSSLNVFITNTTSYRLPLWEAGIDWNEIRDFDLFCMLYKQIDPEVSSMLLNGIDISAFELFGKQTEAGETIVLYDSVSETEITEDVYQHIAQYLREVFGMCPDEKLTSDKTLKEMYIYKDKAAIANAEKKKDSDKGASLQTLISACVNHPGFKYKLKEINEIGICEFYDSVKRLQVYENTTALLKGSMSGMIDISKLPDDSTNFMREI